MTEWLVTDNTTITLGLILAVIVLLGSLFKPQSLVHPILLGRQSDVERVRRKGESAVYRSYSTGLMGRLPIRPAKEVQVLTDLVKPDFEGSRTLWSTKITNAELKARVVALGSGLVRVAGLVPKESNVLLLLNPSIELLITDLALSSHSIPSFTLASSALLSPVLERHPPSAIIVHAHFVGQVLELIMENHETSHHTLIVLGDSGLPKSFDKLKGQIRILKWEDVEAGGAKSAIVETTSPQPDDVFSVSFYPGATGELKAAQLTHMNITAGVTSTRLLLPFEAPMTSSDTIISSYSLATPYGRAIAYTALYDGLSFVTTQSTVQFRNDNEKLGDVDEFSPLLRSGLPSPTILFIAPHELQKLTNPILAQAKRSTLLFRLAWRHKLSALQQGYIAKDSIWDKLVFASARKEMLSGMSETLRGVIVSGFMEANTVVPIRIALSVPFVNVHKHPLVAGPVFASHPLDLQSFRILGKKERGDVFANVAHVGPPAVNVEVKLLHVDDTAVEAGTNPIGEVIVRGPSVCHLLGENDLPERWVSTGEQATIQSNGTFRVLTTAGLA